ncbi:lytic transglycosylase domain-containing protein [Stakelama tenebrarum]|uniref:Lytic transglycosylase domain-containing protein n=1 Tax=Stakelama tenebrarum TaxID=2711215 RepID=A0A6G6Y4Y3_9SPHN|nr:lytic transglycosylase domain-containing protein [Sphingosinithalassobacter tenebrarum]QIG79663.1 lytic transglycosylase domain-containing protein [Sphingosinithalassobacter tenebrarum]
MIGPETLASLPPARRAEIIFRTAQSEMSNRLWRAALGDTEGKGRNSDPNGLGSGGSGFPVETLMQLMGGGTATTGAAAVPGRQHCCCCEHDDAAGGAVAPTPNRVGELGTATIDTARAIAPQSDATLDLGPNQRYAGAISAASAATGVPAPAIAAIVDAESARHADGSWNPLSRNPRSSAAGLGQFLSGTWQDMAQTKGNWLNDVAAQRGWLDASGRVRPEARAELLQLRYDPEASIRTVADFARINLDRLESDGFRVRLDSETVAKAAYLSHHLGLGDARKFLGNAIGSDRARTLLTAQVGSAAAQARIADAGGAVQAHRQWLLGYIAQRVQPDRFTA